MHYDAAQQHQDGKIFSLSFSGVCGDRLLCDTKRLMPILTKQQQTEGRVTTTVVGECCLFSFLSIAVAALFFFLCVSSQLSPFDPLLFPKEKETSFHQQKQRAKDFEAEEEKKNREAQEKKRKETESLSKCVEHIARTQKAEKKVKDYYIAGLFFFTLSVCIQLVCLFFFIPPHQDAISIFLSEKRKKKNSFGDMTLRRGSQQVFFPLCHFFFRGWTLSGWPSIVDKWWPAVQPILRSLGNVDFFHLFQG